MVLRLVINLKLSFSYLVVRPNRPVYTCGGTREHEWLLRLIGKKIKAVAASGNRRAPIRG